MVGIFNLQAWRRVFNKTKPEDRALRLTRKRDLFLAFTIVSLPLIAIASILVGFVFNASEREKPDPSVETAELPIVHYDTATAYYTGITPGSFLLLGSWASNIAEIVVAPFMVIFSYAVARELLQGSGTDSTGSDLRPPLLREIMRGGNIGLWHWGSLAMGKRTELAHPDRSSFRVVNVAGIGLLTATLLTLLVIIGDNWLHVTTYSTQMRYYERVANYAQQNDPLLPPVGPSFRAIDTCNGTLTNPLPQNVSTAPLPCSLNDTSGVTNVADPLNVYRMLDQGISQINSSFNLINFTFLDNAEFNGQSTPIQIVTTLQDGISHALFFNPNAAEDYDLTDFGLGPDYGIDYVANTTSMNTRCTMATKDCGIAAIKPGSIDINQNNISIPFHCYDEFSGNLGQTPATGHERAQGWNMSFYNVIHDSPQNIPVQAQSNPFNFYVAAAVNSINFQDLQDAGTPEADPKNGSLVDVGGGFSAFALNCSATVYDVKFSLVNGSFSLFSATKAPPQKASIIKAPLQVGFGQYRLYQAAQIAVLPNDKSIADTMSTAFSQTGMALASGAFDFDDNAIMRRRWTVNVTKVPKAPFWFLVIVCLIYSVFGIVMTIAAFLLRRTPEIRDQQARLMVEWGPELQKMSDDKVKEQKEREKSRSSDSGLLSFVMS